MKKITLVVCAVLGLLAMPMTASADTSIGIEIGFGIGGSAGRTDGDNTKYTKCRNRNWGGLTTILLRVRRNDIELHGGRWFHDTDYEQCNRDSNVIGLGYVLSTEGRGIKGQKDRYASWTPGIAYVWSDRKSFTEQRPETETTVTNWRMSTNWHMFNRLAIGSGDKGRAIELAYHHYGAFNDDPEINNEQFFTVGLFRKDLDENDGRNGQPPVDKPPEPPMPPMPPSPPNDDDHPGECHKPECTGAPGLPDHEHDPEEDKKDKK